MMLALLTLAFLPYDTLISLGAILRSGRCACCSPDAACCCGSCLRTHAATSTAVAGRFFPGDVDRACSGCGAGRGAGMTSQPAAWLYAAPILLLWLLSPLRRLVDSADADRPHPRPERRPESLPAESARRPWRFFADFVGPDDNWLPPDNLQDYPEPAIASRTSPTIHRHVAVAGSGCLTISGYITAGECLQRVGNTLASMEKLERYRGHL